MKIPKSIYRISPLKTHIDWIRGIAICSFAAGPIFLLAGLANKAIMQRSFASAITAFLEIEPVKLLTGCATVSVGSLPTVALIALVLHVLGRRGNDAFPLASMAGTSAGFVGLAATVSAYVGSARNVDPIGFKDMAMFLVMSALLTVLFWVAATRPQRRKRTLAHRHQAAIRAME